MTPSHGAEIHGLHIQITSYIYIAVSDPKHRLFHLHCLPVSALPVTSSCLLNISHLLGVLCHIKLNILLEHFKCLPKHADSVEKKGDGSIFIAAVHSESLMPASA